MPFLAPVALYTHRPNGQPGAVRDWACVSNFAKSGILGWFPDRQAREAWEIANAGDECISETCNICGEGKVVSLTRVKIAGDWLRRGEGYWKKKNINAGDVQRKVCSIV